jgi:SAM-dependent methyltransferase
MGEAYVHGYSEREAARLLDQAHTLTDLLHHDMSYPAGSRVLEVGCGVGAQTGVLAASSPGAAVTSIDLSLPSLRSARSRTLAAGYPQVAHVQADLFGLPFSRASIDHVFLCFVLEHLTDPVAALLGLTELLRPGGTFTVIEGDHGSANFHPDDPDARRVIQCLVEVQRSLGGDAMVGRRLYPLLVEAGLDRVEVSPRLVYVDASRPTWVEGFTRNTFIAMVAGAREAALRAGMLGAAEWEKGIRGLERATEADGTFCYTFFKATAVQP